MLRTFSLSACAVATIFGVTLLALACVNLERHEAEPLTGVTDTITLRVEGMT